LAVSRHRSFPSSYSFASALDAVITQRKHHTREAKRLLSLAPSITTTAVKARILRQAREHAMLAGLVWTIDPSLDVPMRLTTG
jgi:hypothetical protein